MDRRKFIKNTLLTTGAGTLLQACGGSDSNIKKKNGKTKVVLIGVDGANWPTLDPLIEQGKLPFWKSLKEQTAWTNLETFRPTKSSVVWTSIATGKRMEKHGILDFTYLNKNNIEVPFSGAERREPAFWQILDSFKKKSIIVNWFVTHPPDKINGIMVSDVFRMVMYRKKDKMDQYKNSVHPGIYFHKLVKLGDRNYERVLKNAGIPDYPAKYTELHEGANFKNVPILKTFRALAVQDNFAATVAKELFRTKDFDMFASYIRMPDLIQHFSTRMFTKEYNKEVVEALKSGKMTPEKHKEVINNIAKIIEPAYTFAEDLIKNLMSFKKYEDAYFIICSDHGFSLYPGGYNHYDLPEHMTPPPGILMVKGPDVKTGHFSSPASVYDITPTILNLFNVPVGKNMDGKVLSSIFKKNRRIKYKTYKLKSQKKRDSKVDQDTMDQLKSIGYI